MRPELAPDIPGMAFAVGVLVDNAGCQAKLQALTRRGLIKGLRISLGALMRVWVVQLGHLIVHVSG
jgi:hypothetical protein